MEALIDSVRLKEIFVACLPTPEEIKDITGKTEDEIRKELKENEPPDGICYVKGIVSSFWLKKDSVEKNREEIKKMLSQLHDSFMKEGGGGMSTIEMCNDKDGNQWGEQTNVQELVVLGKALGYVEYCLSDKKLWSTLPGGMPYVVVDLVRRRNNIETVSLTETVSFKEERE